MSAETSTVRIVVLLTLTLAIGLVLMQWVLAPLITERQRDIALHHLGQLAAPVTFDNDPFAAVVDLRSRAGLPGLNAHLIRAMPLRRGNQRVGMVVDTRAPGYIDDIVLRVAMSTDGRVLGIRVLEHRETAGLGDRLIADDWLGQFSGRDTMVGDERWRLRRDGGQVDQLTGATVTSRGALHALLLGASMALEEVSP